MRHIWGDANCGNDFCADTPTQRTSSGGCPTGNNSCGSTDMVENYMDYSFDTCMDTFTVDQVGRMRTVMANSPGRVELPNSPKGGAGVPTISFDTTANKIAIISYIVVASDKVLINYVGDFGSYPQ